MTFATLATVALSMASAAMASRTSSKRGIVYVTPEVSTDNTIWTGSNDMTWYYNYQTTPTTAFVGSHMQFVPMQWGLPNNYRTDMSFYNSVRSLQKQGTNITWVLGYNEPDGCTDGGSCIDPEQAAIAWVTQFEPMRKDLGVKLGGPAVTGASTGWTWLQQFHMYCAKTKNNATGCEMDFLPIHWYGNFDGLASHLGQVNSTYKNVSEFWVTEFGYPNEDLATTQTYFNTSVDYFDRLDIVEKYAWFGPFRSDVSNVGPNGAFLTSAGKLTDIGSYYLGGDATGNIPTSTKATGTSTNGSSTTQSPKTYTGKPYSLGYRPSVPAGLTVFVLGAAFWTLF